MLKALVPVDGSNNSMCAVRHVIKLVQDREPLEIHLLNVQPPFHGDVTSFVAKEDVEGFHLDEAHKALHRACELLNEAAVHYTKHVYVGHAAEVIAEVAKELGCDKVIMGTHGYGTVRQLMMGSISHKAIHLMDPGIPVTLVKDGYAAGPARRPAAIATAHADAR
ncbi:MAG TPA: universal stress protein [Beijerinckiaceae bacterium]|nr:universal stress protein [Beijerinckiaceae bacterium]